MICKYCGEDAVWCENKVIYGKNYGKSYMCYYCRPCDAYVGCHNNTREPLGSLANRETREWRKKTHASFDPLWKDSSMNRKQAYAILKRHFGHQIHIGESDVDKCKAIIEFIKSVKWGFDNE